MILLSQGFYTAEASRPLQKTPSWNEKQLALEPVEISEPSQEIRNSFNGSKKNSGRIDSSGPSPGDGHQ